LANPTEYDRQFGFAAYAAQHPSDPLPGNQVDAEMNAVKASLDETQAALADVRRSDGALLNGSVGLDQLAPDVLVGIKPASAWAASTAYAVDDIVFSGLILYRCTAEHTSGVSFDASKFTELADFSSLSLPPGSVGTTALADNSVVEVKLADGAVSVAKLGSFPGSALMGRHSTSSGAVQFIGLGAGLSFVNGLLTASATTLADNAVTTPKIADANVTAAKLAGGVAASNLGYAPVNRAGDNNISGVLVRSGQGAHLWHGGTYGSGQVTVSSSAPSGGNDGDIWLKI
jgi:hypothetical protein